MSLEPTATAHDDFEIKPKTGFGKILIGMSRNQIEDIIGRPEEFKAEYSAGKPVRKEYERWIFESGLDLMFYAEDDFLLSVITVSKGSAFLDGTDILSLTEAELKVEFPNLVLEDDFAEFGKDYVCREKELSFWVVEAEVDSVAIFAEYTADGNKIIWPKV